MMAVTLPDDGEVVYLESTGAGVEPDLTPEEQIIFGLESDLKEFYYLFDDMKDVGGMKRSFAMEMHRLVPDSAQKYPLGYFTEQPTATLYRPALEELHEGVWALIGAAALAITVMIWKLVRWITGKSKDDLPEPSSSGSGPSDTQLSAAIKDAEHVAEKRNNITDEIAHEAKNLADVAPDMLDAVVNVAASIKIDEVQEGRRASNDPTGGDGKGGSKVTLDEVTDQLLDLNKHKHLYDLVYQKNNGYYDLMVTGEWTKFVLALGPATLGLEQWITSHMDALRQIMDNPRLFDSDQMNSASMKRHVDALGKGFVFQHTDFHNLDEMAKAIAGARDRQAVNTSNTRLQMVHATRKMEMFMNGKPFRDLKFVSVNAAAGMERVARIRSELDNLMKLNRPRPDQGQNGSLSHEISRELAKPIHTLMHACTVFFSAIVVIEHFIDTVSRFTADQSYYLQSVANALEVFNKRTKNPVEFPEKIKEARGIINHMKGLFSKLPKKHKL